MHFKRTTGNRNGYVRRRAAKKIKEAAEKLRRSDFLPEVEDIARAIALQGTSEDEMAMMLGIEPSLLKKWKKFYPSFAKALDEGHTEADAEVMAALYKRAVGFKAYHDVVTADGDKIRLFSKLPPDTPAIKYWLNNRQTKRWRESQHVGVGGGSKGDSPLTVRDETKHQLMSSILSLIQSKPDDPDD